MPWHSAHHRPLFVTVAKFEGRGECTVKRLGSEGCASRRLVSREFLLPQSFDWFDTIFRNNEGCGGSAARDLARAADVSRKADERAAATVATSVVTTAKGLAMGSWAEGASFLRVFSSHKSFLVSWFHQLAPSLSPQSFAVHWSSTNNTVKRMKLITTAVPLPVLCSIKEFYSEIEQ